MRPDLFLATIGRGSNGSNALEVTEDRAAVTAESQDNIINRVNNVSQYGPSWHYVPGIGVAGTAYAEVPGSALGDLAFTRASSKTRTNSAGVVETIGNNVPPHDYRNADGTLSTFPRLNLEPQRTNSIRNSSMVGAVAGTPGTLPTNYGQGGAGGSVTTRTIVGTGTENGLPYIDIRYQGNTAGQLRLITESGAIAAASVGSVYTNSTYIKLVSGTAPQIQLVIANRDGSNNFISDNLGPLFNLSSTLTRYTYTATIAQAGTAFAQPLLQWVFAATAYDFTIRIAAPQMELGGYATTWVPTTTAAVTRLADTASKTGVSSLIGQTEGTLFFELSALALDSSTWRTIGVSDGTSANMINFYFTGTSASNRMRALIRASSVDSFNEYYIGPTITNTIKIAIAYASNDAAFYVNGTQVAIDSSITVPVCNRFQFAEAATGAPMLANINQYALFTTRLTNAQLAQLTTL